MGSTKNKTEWRVSVCICSGGVVYSAKVGESVKSKSFPSRFTFAKVQQSTIAIAIAMDEAEFQRLLQLFPSVRSRDYIVTLYSHCLCFQGLESYRFFLIFYSYYSQSQISLPCCLKFRFLRYPCCEFCGLHAVCFLYPFLKLCFQIVLDYILHRKLRRVLYELGLFDDDKDVVSVLKQGNSNL